MKARNILFLILASLLLCTAVSAAEYTDVSDAHWAYKQINYLDAEITGYPDDTKLMSAEIRTVTRKISAIHLKSGRADLPVFFFFAAAKAASKIMLTI